ncbi:MAG TPA: hypothetical protein PKY77_26265 [Phycisphaerae bacterium]|nr:hypothetical protein [Phycisphaerae bacterium]
MFAMNLALQRVKVYVKFGATAITVLLIALVVFKNLGLTANVWFFHEYKDVGVLWLILITAVCAIIGWWGVGKLYTVWRDLKELKQAQQVQRHTQDQQRMAAELAEREKRIDEKIRRSISDDAPNEQA